MSTNFLKTTVRKIFSSLGYTLVPTDELETILDVRQEGVTPLAKNYSGTDCILADLLLCDARDPFFFSYSGMSWHPYVAASRAAINSPGTLYETLYATLEAYYQNACPQSIACFLGLSDGPSIEFLQRTPAYGFVWPWERTSVDQKLKHELQQMAAVSRKQLGQRDIGLRYGWKFGGPAEPTLIHNEAARLEHLIESIKTNGFFRHNGKDGDVAGFAMENQLNQWRWSISSGMHRAAVAAAFGIESIPARIRSIVRRQDVLSWPNVKCRLYSTDNALQIFDRLFNAAPADASRGWTKSIHASPTNKSKRTLNEKEIQGVCRQSISRSGTQTNDGAPTFKAFDPI